ncbi:hypothetical protein [Siphonobacter sp. SORGH_AS_1065]|uniref:hypothetical protein n=1 Tax=Siphonobacter sp. SORGH_AS_1065 TaxID=3041795 RepID=UPI00277D62AE|nr:hypothetical protein [Siphonobacter sp. SORGH_AS_1065]MDQ1085667.1 hypothetical protein [Siphonobacter sp. SORGH_AS_1065]
MPIDRKQYHPKWSLITRLIRARAGNSCEGCGVKNDTLVERGKGKEKGTFRYATGCEIINYHNLRLEGKKYWDSLKELGLTRISLSVAHLDRNRENNRFTNFKCLCQCCHLNYDRAYNNWLKEYGKNESTLSIFN